jgi:hypothetical protein
MQRYQVDDGLVVTLGGPSQVRSEISQRASRDAM